MYVKIALPHDYNKQASFELLWCYLISEMNEQKLMSTTLLMQHKHLKTKVFLKDLSSHTLIKDAHKTQ